MKTMRIGMNLLLWTDSPAFIKHEELVCTLHKWGFDGVEFPVAPMSHQDISAFSSLCDSLGLGRSAILALDAETADPASSDHRLRLAALNEIKRAIDKSIAIGANVLCGPLFQGLGRFTGAAPTPAEWGWSAETLRLAGEYALEGGVSLALEPLNRFEMYMVNTMEQATQFVKNIALPNVGLLADTHHSNIEENHTAEAWSKSYESIVHVHISENHRGMPGSGHAVTQGVFELLLKRNYEGWLTIEAFGQSVVNLIPRLHLWRAYAENEERIARGGLEFIRSQILPVRE
ncbi:sugar phosphate isomerase/epimerase [Paenibacillus psychroresistens]|uniref:Sugar phosphate isomerase/epimerase n=1 Tax=Paenibacillus psychroresistens TaxID=1778678 RepID=A0A6B8RUH1_9BACL|nr:sugar phosphate isomerase/epimerase family protein [Paenibacillus psychroresistens]QGQ99255.1 sugar phosphate isomerase/epimerase [Paenibacillus psychroresistens]